MADIPEDAREVPPSRKAQTPTWVNLSGLGFEFVAAILLPGGIGWWLDRRFGSMPWIMLIGGLLGFAVGLRLLIKSVGRS